MPARRRGDLVARLLDHVVADRGRLIIGVFSEEPADRATERELAAWRFSISGRGERPHPDPRLVYRSVWIDR